jgi:methionyl-tRNA formyltransferase
MPLRPLIESDFEFLKACLKTTDLQSNFHSQLEITLSENQIGNARVKNDANTRWFIHNDYLGKSDGLVCFTQMNRSLLSTFIWIYTAPDALPGTAIRLGYAALENAFDEMGLHKLNADILACNETSLRNLTKLGFKEEGIFRDFFFDGQTFDDVVRLGMLATEWNANRKEIQARIDKLDALKKKKSYGAKIIVLTDRHSWISPYLEDLVEEWGVTGHECKIENNSGDVETADFCFCLSYSKILPAKVRANFKHTLVVHESNLPDGRGWAPMTWQILNGSNHIAVTLLEAVDAVDAGPIYLQEWIELNGTELNYEWRKLQAEATKRLCTEWIDTYPAVLNLARQQVGVESFYARRRPKDSKLDVEKSLTSQFNLLRVVDNNYYPAFFEIYGKRFEIRVNTREND